MISRMSHYSLVSHLKLLFRTAVYMLITHFQECGLNITLQLAFHSLMGHDYKPQQLTGHKWKHIWSIEAWLHSHTHTHIYMHCFVIIVISREQCLVFPFHHDMVHPTGCGWKRQSPYTEGSCKYGEQKVTTSPQTVVLQIECRVRG
jgi:hypothetical protein